MQFDDKLKQDIKRFCLENAVKFKGKCNPGAIIGKIISENPDSKTIIKDISKEVNSVSKKINELKPEEQKKELEKLNPDFERQKKEKKEKRKKERSELPELKDAEEGKVVTRMPPGPSKYAHIGHAISFGINWLYAQKYKGKCILRFDDTNPEVEAQEYVDSMKDDIIDYLGFRPDKIVFASDHIERLYSMIEKLISENKVYACNCPSEKISDSRKKMKECSHRGQDKKETEKIWKDMKEGDSEDYALRLNIDMKHKNAVMRDPVLMRVIKKEHYRQGRKFNVWPMYDFESAILDSILGITHVLRSNEFDSRIELHNHIAGLFDYGEIYYKHYGRSAITGALTKGREIRKKIEEGEYIGWDDPRLVTLKALKRRGIVKEAIWNLVKRAGLSKNNTNIDFSVIATENRKILDAQAKRYFFIQKPKKIQVKGAPKLDITLDLHPDNKKGGRKFRTGEEFYVEEKDYKSFKDDKMIRLMDCLNLIKEKDNFVFKNTDYEEFKEKGDLIIHWLPVTEELIDVEIMMPDMKVLQGLGEKTVKNVKVGEVIQFERFGFCRLDSIDKDKNREHKKFKFWFTHD